MTRRTLPVLLVASELTAALAMRLAEEATGLCRLVFVVDRSWSERAAPGRLLGRLGEVVEVERLDSSSARRRLARCEPAGVAVFQDAQIVAAASLAEGLGLEFHLPGVAATLADKELQRRALERAGLAGPRHLALVDGPFEASAAAVAAAGVRYPAVLKPRSGTASREVQEVADPAALEATIAALPEGCSPGQYLIEEQLSGSGTAASRFGDYVSVETMAIGGALCHVAITGRRPVAPPFRESGLFVPSDIGEPLAAEVLELAEAASAALGISTGVLHIEIKLTPDGPRLIEVNGRVGGAVPELVEAAGEPLSLTRAALQLALGQAAPRPRGHFERVAYRLICQPPVGATRVLEIRGTEELRRLPGVREVYVNRPPGSAVDWRRGFDEFVLHVFGTVPDHDALLALCERVEDLVEVRYEEAGEDPRTARRAEGAAVVASAARRTRMDR